MSKLFSRIGGVAAAAALVLSVGVGSAAANVNTYQDGGNTVSITTSNVSAAVGTTTKVPVTVSVSGLLPYPIANEKILNTLYGIPDSQFDGLSVANYGCAGRVLYPGQSCTSTIAFTPNFVGTHNEAYVIPGRSGNLYGRFTATGLRAIYGVIAPSSGLLAP